MAQPGSQNATTHCLVTCIDVWVWLAWCKKRPSARLCRYGEIERFSAARLARCTRCMRRCCVRQKCEEVNTRPGNQTALVCSLFGWTQATKHRHLARVQPGRAEPGSLLGAWLRWAANHTRPKPLYEDMSSQAPTTMPGNRTGSSKDEVYFNSKGCPTGLTIC